MLRSRGYGNADCVRLPSWSTLYSFCVRVFYRGNLVSALLKFALGVDWISDKFGKLAAWAVLGAALISAGNAFVRYGLDISSNGWLEIQWYLFAVTVMLGAPIVLKLNEHVRVDIFYGRLKGNGQIYIDLFGLVFFLMPVMALLAYLSWPLFMKMYVSGEMSQNAGGLIRWPAMLTLPLGFGWMVAQGLSEIIKRISFLQGNYGSLPQYEKPVQ
jgi:TRAP-type mannitol/chloroaromatic compound transport system permease small subunit